MRTIILAAGQGFQLDGFNKLLLCDPVSGELLIDKYLKLFADTEITVVLGYKAIEIMQRYPHINYVYNTDWKMTNSSYSLSLALNEEPCYIMSCDLFFDQDIVTKFMEAEPNCVLTKNTDNRQLNALNCSVQDDRRITEIYQGDIRRKKDPESIGLYKIGDRNLLREWRKRCIHHSNLFAGQNLPFNICPVYSVDVEECRFEEVNTVMDYMRILENVKRRRS